jgi:integrase
MLQRACGLARRWSGNLLPNPVSDTELPQWTLGEQPSEQRSPNVDEVRAILAAASSVDARLAAFIRVVAATGARRSEICALRWHDINYLAAKIILDEATVAVEGVRIKGPKNRASIRSIAIDLETLAQLQLLRKEREAIATRCGVTVGVGGFVFATDPTRKKAPHPDAMSHAFARLRKQANVVTDIHLHSLRHFQSTELDTIISEAQKESRTGWATVHMARHYTDRITEEDVKAAAHIASGGPPKNVKDGCPPRAIWRRL